LFGDPQQWKRLKEEEEDEEEEEEEVKYKMMFNKYTETHV
jgi:hypothetical protein